MSYNIVVRRNTTTICIKRGEKKTMTPYRVIKLLNEQYSCNYPTQLGYNYVRAGLIPGKKIDGKWFVSETDAKAWIQKFASRNLKVSN